MDTTSLSSLALAAASLLALTGCDAAEREPEALHDTCPVGDHAEARGMETTLRVGSAP